MGSNEAQTETLIKEKARILFFQKGFLNATTQEIADEAGVNRALIHYYFRSREQLMDVLLHETVIEKRDKVIAILGTDAPFREKIRQYIDVVVDHGLTYPYLDNFVISETARDPDKIKFLCPKEKKRSVELIRVQLQEEIDKGRIAPITPEHFMINLASLCHYPLLARTLLQTIHGMSDAVYRKFLQDRKQIIFSTVFNEVPGNTL